MTTEQQIIQTVATLTEKVDHLITNHLPHIQKRLDVIDDRMWKAVITIVSVLVGILLTLLFK